jgi:hypothetical protein
MSTHGFSLFLAILGVAGIAFLLIRLGMILRQHQRCPTGSFRWQMRNHYLKQISALASLFFLAMAASYAVLFQAWALLYLVVAFKTVSWWLRLAMTQRA